MSIAAAKAGTDLLLFSDYHDGARAFRALLAKLQADEIDRGRFERSVQRGGEVGMAGGAAAVAAEVDDLDLGQAVCGGAIGQRAVHA